MIVSYLYIQYIYRSIIPLFPPSYHMFLLYVCPSLKLRQKKRPTAFCDFSLESVNLMLNRYHEFLHEVPEETACVTP